MAMVGMDRWVLVLLVILVSPQKKNLRGSRNVELSPPHNTGLPQEAEGWRRRRRRRATI
jgi:hypothetical protein